MAARKDISRILAARLEAARRDGATAVEAARWLVEEGVLPAEPSPVKRLRSLMRQGKVRGAYQFPNKRWVVVNTQRLPDGIQRVVPLPEAAETLHLSVPRLRQYVREGALRPLDFGPGILLFHEEELRRFHRDFLDRTFRTLFPLDKKDLDTADLDRLRRQLYYLRADVRLIAERIEELIRMLE
jgi:DNA-binding transcriptional MerR regulator